jgi:hypothetical protein
MRTFVAVHPTVGRIKKRVVRLAVGGGTAAPALIDSDNRSPGRGSSTMRPAASSNSTRLLSACPRPQSVSTTTNSSPAYRTQMS